MLQLPLLGGFHHDGNSRRPQGKLFYTNINLDQRIRANHPLRKIDQLIDFDFAYKEVENTYGNNGNVSFRHR